MADPSPFPGVARPGQIVHEILDISFAKGLDRHAGLLCLKKGRRLSGEARI